jgi:hypothetical protein
MESHVAEMLAESRMTFSIDSQKILSRSDVILKRQWPGYCFDLPRYAGFPPQLIERYALRFVMEILVEARGPVD